MTPVTSYEFRFEVWLIVPVPFVRRFRTCLPFCTLLLNPVISFEIRVMKCEIPKGLLVPNVLIFDMAVHYEKR